MPKIVRRGNLTYIPEDYHKQGSSNKFDRAPDGDEVAVWQKLPRKKRKKGKKKGRR
jgi:hypothetical protein